MGSMTICADTSIRESDAISSWITGDIFSKINLVHDAIASRNNINIFKGCFGPFNKMKPVFVTSIFYGSVFVKGIRSSPLYSTASEWSTINWVGTTGLTLDGSPPCSAIASRNPAKINKAVCPKIS